MSIIEIDLLTKREQIDALIKDYLEKNLTINIYEDWGANFQRDGSVGITVDLKLNDKIISSDNVSFNVS